VLPTAAQPHSSLLPSGACPGSVSAAHAASACVSNSPASRCLRRRLLPELRCKLGQRCSVAQVRLPVSDGLLASHMAAAGCSAAGVQPRRRPSSVLPPVPALLARTAAQNWRHAGTACRSSRTGLMSAPHPATASSEAASPGRKEAELAHRGSSARGRPPSADQSHTLPSAQRHARKPPQLENEADCTPVLCTRHALCADRCCPAAQRSRSGRCHSRTRPSALAVASRPVDGCTSMHRTEPECRRWFPTCREEEGRVGWGAQAHTSTQGRRPTG
jgi:hypothetical protein